MRRNSNITTSKALQHHHTLSFHDPYPLHCHSLLKITCQETGISRSSIPFDFSGSTCAQVSEYHCRGNFDLTKLSLFELSIHITRLSGMFAP